MRFVYFFLAIAMLTFGILTGIIGSLHANPSVLITAAFATVAGLCFAMAWITSEISRARRNRRTTRRSQLIDGKFII